MNAERYHNLVREPIKAIPEKSPEIANAVQNQINKLTAEEQVLLLSNEEDDLIRAFRRFKARMKRDGEVFKWQTRRESGVIIPKDRALIVSPQEEPVIQFQGQVGG